MARSASAIERLTSMTSLLGGPTIRSADIEWATDLPAGKKLVEWLAAQLMLEDLGDGEISVAENALYYQAVLEDVALEEEELQILKRSKFPQSSTSNNSGNVSLTPAGYVLPSRMRARVKYMDNESSLLESEMELLKSRLRQTKAAAQKISQSMRSLQSEIERVDDDLREKQERLGELSINADIAISSSIHTAHHLLDTFASQHKSSDTDGPGDHDPYSLAAVSSLSSLRSSIIDHSNSQIHDIDNAVTHLPDPREIKSEASRLHEAFNEPTSAKLSLLEEAEEAAFAQEVLEICTKLDGSVMSRDALSNILREGQVIYDHVDPHTNVDVKGELEHAWSLDQREILKSRGRVLDKTITSFKTLLPPLNNLYDRLLNTDSQIREAEALLGALGEEVEEVVDDVRSAKEHNELSRPKAATEIEDEILEGELVDLLKRLRDLRPDHAAPLVLLDRNDVLTEIRSIIDRTKALDQQEVSWISGLPENLRALSSAHATLHTAAYAHSPMNTSPPFALPVEVLGLENEAKVKGEGLGEVVERLEKEIEMLEHGRTKRKLGAFVDKWGRGK